MNPINWVQDLQGPAVIALICGLLFIEEVGVPLPFAPGDIVLALAGIAIAGGRVNALSMVGAAAAATIVGAIGGHQLAGRLGWERLMRIAEPLHARKPLERASEALQRGGARAVFTARLIPGLRVYTTQVAGVSNMPMRTFVGGLVPATAVYLAAFLGLGAAFGRPVLGLIQKAEHQLLLAIVLVAALIGLVLLSRAPVRKGLAVLQAGGWTGPLRFSLEQVGLALILGSIGLNFAGHALAEALNLPLFLDSTGTILAGVVAGPWVGASVGLISNLVTANSIDPISAPYALVSFMLGFVAGLSRYLNWRQCVSGWMSLWLVCVAVAALVSTPLNFLMSSGRSGVALGDSLFAALVALHLPRVLAAFLGEASVDLPDKLVTVVAALLIAQSFREAAPSTSGRTELDLRQAFTFVVRSKDWLRRFAVAMLCVLFFWLVIPYLLLSGYVVEVTRTVRGGHAALPPWPHRWRLLGNGFRVTCALLIWLLPSVALSIPAALVSALQERTGADVPIGLSSVTGIIAGLGSLWIVIVLLLEPAIISLFLERGFRGAVNLVVVIRRFRVNLALSVVVGTLVVVLTMFSVLGLAALAVGVLLTLPYASFVGAYLVGMYARQTGPPVRSGSNGSLPGAPRDLAAEMPAP